jgi:hypothetical protein
MRISFDLDDTLVCHFPGAPVEKKRWLGKLCGCFGEPLRKGACSLMGELRARGHSIWIYTTSGRSPFQIRLWLFGYGIRVHGIVNDQRHRREASRRGLSYVPSKYPPAFDIDLHVDDSEGVRTEGEQHGFRVVVVRPDDEDWIRQVLGTVSRTQMGAARAPAP